MITSSLSPPSQSPLSRHSWRSAGAAALALFAATHSTDGAVFTAGSGDITVVYSGGVLSPRWLLETGATVDNSPLGSSQLFAPGQVVAFVDHPFTPRPVGTEWDFIGVPPGAPMWDFPMIFNPAKPFIALSTEELVPGDWSQMSVSLVSVSGPAGGDFSLSVTGSMGTIAQMATSDGISSADSFSLLMGGHTHHLFAFTQPGVYQVTFQWDGVHGVDGSKSALGTYVFGVTAVPEPEAALPVVVLLAGGLALILRHRRRTAGPAA